MPQWSREKGNRTVTIAVRGNSFLKVAIRKALPFSAGIAGRSLRSQFDHESQHYVAGCKTWQSRLRLWLPRTTADRMAAHRRLDQRRVAEPRKRVVSYSLRPPSGSLNRMVTPLGLHPGNVALCTFSSLHRRDG